MNKQTKVALSVAVLGVGGYLLYKNFKSTKTSFVGNQPVGSRKKLYTGNTVGQRKKLYTGKVGDRMIPYTGNAGKRQKNLTDVFDVKETTWVRYTGSGYNGTPKNFFDIRDGFSK